MIKIYTDGSCLENPGNGGWAAIIINNGQKTEIKGSKKNTTNNQMELLAPIEALKKIPEGSKVFVISIKTGQKKYQVVLFMGTCSLTIFFFIKENLGGLLIFIFQLMIFKLMSLQFA